MGSVLPEDHPLTFKDPPLRSQELADLSRRSTGVDTVLHPIGQVKQRHVGGQGEGGLQRHNHGIGLPVGKVGKFLIILECHVGPRVFGK